MPFGGKREGATKIRERSMDKADDRYQKFQEAELRAFLTKRLAEVSERFGEDSETARLYRERLAELQDCEVEEVVLARA